LAYLTAREKFIAIFPHRMVSKHFPTPDLKSTHSSTVSKQLSTANMSDDDDALYLAVLEAEEKGTIPFLNSNKHGEAFATSSTGMHRLR